MRQDVEALEFAGPRPRSDRLVLLEAIKKMPRALAYAGGDLPADREVVWAAVRADGWLLQYASEKLRSDRELVLMAVRESGSAAMAYASSELQCDPELNKICDQHRRVYVRQRCWPLLAMIIQSQGVPGASSAGAEL